MEPGQYRRVSDEITWYRNGAEVLRFECLIGRDYPECYRVPYKQHLTDVVARWQRSRPVGLGQVSALTLIRARLGPVRGAEPHREGGG